jgi:hypothetical protein
MPVSPVNDEEPDYSEGMGDTFSAGVGGCMALRGFWETRILVSWLTAAGHPQADIQHFTITPISSIADVLDEQYPQAGGLKSPISGH